MIKKFLLALALVTAPLVANAEPVSFAEGTVLLEMPDGFKQLSKEQIALKFPRNKPPGQLIGNEKASTTIAYGLRPSKLPQDQIELARKAFTKVFTQVLKEPQFKENKVIELAGQRWGYLEMTAKAVDTDIYNIVLFTGYQDKTLILNFNSTKKDFPLYEKALRKSISSLQLKK